MDNNNVLIVDDETIISKIIKNCLFGMYQVTCCESVSDAKIALKKTEFGVAILDLNLPDANGIELLAYIKKEHPLTESIILTAFASLETAIDALKLGVVDYLTKPFTLDDIRNSVKKAFELRRSKLHVSSLDETMEVLAATVSKRDPYTATHQKQVAKLCLAIAQAMGFEKSKLDILYLSCIIHDIGKIYVPTEILNKPGKLNDIEMSLIRMHTIMGYDIIKTIKSAGYISNVILQHHETLDGKGYPHGLKNGSILLEAKILTVADVVEAMTSHRPYRPALGIKTALEEINKFKKIKYDENIADICIRLCEKHGKTIFTLQPEDPMPQL